MQQDMDISEAFTSENHGTQQLTKISPKTLLLSVSVATRVFRSARPHLHWRVIAARLIHRGQSGRNYFGLDWATRKKVSWLMNRTVSARAHPEKVQYGNIFGRKGMWSHVTARQETTIMSIGVDNVRFSRANGIIENTKCAEVVL